MQKILLQIVTIVTTAVAISRADAKDAPDFARDIRPILSNACFHCHGPDDLTREADLRLDTQNGLFQQRDGYSIVNPGDVDGSELIQRILSHDADLQMPPADAKKQLTDQQKQLLVQWVQSGANWSQHWAFIAPVKPPVPEDAFGKSDGNEIDRFLHQTQARNGVEPSGEADVMSLIRRVWLDLIGLPPTVQEADEWAGRLVSAEASQVDELAWRQLIDNLQSRPEYGERWARRWLDLARYADTNGYEKDRPRSIWPYRDWVIDAINTDMPFDQFTIEQLAGDMLPNATTSQKIATGFHRNTMLNEEGGIDPLEFRFHAMTDRVATTGTTWFGLTLQCAQCHTHKYDPITHSDYYRLMAFLNNADEPSLELADASLDDEWKKRIAKAKELTRNLADKWPVVSSVSIPATLIKADALGASQADSGINSPDISPDDASPQSGPASIRQLDDSWLSPAPSHLPDRPTYVVRLTPETIDFDTVNLHFRTRGRRPGPGNSSGGNLVLSEIKVQAKLITATSQLDQPKDNNVRLIELPIESATSTVEQSGYELARSFDGDSSTGWGLHGPKGIPKDVEASFRLKQSAVSEVRQLAVGQDAQLQLVVSLSQQHGSSHSIGDFQIDLARQLSADEIEQRRQASIQTSYDDWLKEARANAVSWAILHPTSATSNLPILTIESDDSIFASGDTAKRDDYQITLAPADHVVTAIRLEALPDERLPNRGPGSTYYEGTLGDFFLTEFEVFSAYGKHSIEDASETYAQNRFGNNPATAKEAIDGDIQTGWSVHGRQGERHVAVFQLKEPIEAGQPIRIQMSFGRHFASSLGRFRFSGCQSQHGPKATDYASDIEELLRAPLSDLSVEDQNRLFQQFLFDSPKLREPVEQIRNLQRRPDSMSTLVFSERPENHPRPTFRHHRGEYLQPEESVTPGTPDVLHSWPVDQPANRLEFARWIVRAENPLTSRVVVNRHWATFFGRGIVETVDDFGLQGSPPDHPELLDWLAVTFVQDDAWSIKSLHRRIVSSSTYRQASVYRHDAAVSDPQNRLLTYMPRLRLEAEIIRDSVLNASGVLSLKKGGPPVMPLQPAGITEVAFGSPKWNVSGGEDRYRRSIYTMIKRTAPFAMVTTFDGPGGESCIAQRDRSNTPLQALTLMNDVMFVDLAKHAAVHLLADLPATESHPDLDSIRLEMLFRRVLTRVPEKSELADLKLFLQKQRERFQSNGQQVDDLLGRSAGIPAAVDHTEVAAWMTVARALFAVDEFVTRP
ncbi:MAG: PSD1 domain-containing protein [Planctomycetaceae bacterium]|nr:PSD1 domain-containing protein [Planctomycetaceae bacterium]